MKTTTQVKKTGNRKAQKSQQPIRTSARGRGESPPLDVVLGADLLPVAVREADAGGYSLANYVAVAVHEQAEDDARKRALFPDDREAMTLKLPISGGLRGGLVMASARARMTPDELVRKALVQLTSAPAATAPPSTSSAAAAPTPPGWAEANGITTVPREEKTGGDFSADDKQGCKVPLPGLAQYQHWPKATVLDHLVYPVLNASEVLGRLVLPKLPSAWETCEFADLLWTAHAYCESTGDSCEFGQRTDLAGEVGREILGEGRFRLERFFSEVLCVRAPEIIRYALPRVGPMLAAGLSEALALAELLAGGLEDFHARRRASIEANATPLQRQAWEARARAWLHRDLWSYSSNDEFRARDPLVDAVMDGKTEAAA